MGRINVTLQSGEFGIDQTMSIMREILGRGGCPGCFSGLDINFTNEIAFMVDAGGSVAGLRG